MLRLCQAQVQLKLSLVKFLKLRQSLILGLWLELCYGLLCYIMVWYGMVCLVKSSQVKSS